MPPFVGVKRGKSESPVSSSPTAPEKSGKKLKKPQSLFDAADQRPAGSLKKNEEFLNGLAGSDSETSLTEVSSDEIVYVELQPAVKKRKTDHHDDDDEEVEWEDAMHDHPANVTPSSAIEPSGDLELTLDKGSGVGSFVNNQKKGPSKIERQIRIVTHCMHVQFLVFHNSIRSRWACDPEVQQILMVRISLTAKKEIDIWKNACGHTVGKDQTESPQPSRSKRGTKGQDEKNEDVRSQRDWGKPAERQEIGVANTSRGDPIYRLLTSLTTFWKQRFAIRAPGLRKQGYKSLSRLEEEIASFKSDQHDSEDHGERIANLEEFRNYARICEGSRDVGVQLFVALLRALGLEARLVASLQPLGFGWNKNEEAGPKKKRVMKKLSPTDLQNAGRGRRMGIDPQSRRKTEGRAMTGTNEKQKEARKRK